MFQLTGPPWPVGVFQFVKSAKWKVGEENALKVLGASGEGGSVVWNKMGEGWSWVQRDDQLNNEEAAREGWEQVKRDLAAETYRLYVLDELRADSIAGLVKDVQETNRRAA